MTESTTHHDPLPTRSSLLSRLRHASDAGGWHTFHEQYMRLIFHVCMKSGLAKEDAEDVAQETLAAVAKQMPEFQHDRARGSFRGWLYRITANKVADFLRRKYRENAVRGALPQMPDGRTGPVESLPDEDHISAAWDDEWRSHIMERALQRVQGRLSARTMQIFHLSAVKGWSADQIRETLRVGRAAIYLARHRAGRLVKKEIERLREELE
jgi:RNA polymerase sigma factor (sigma-70 family)